MRKLRLGLALAAIAASIVAAEAQQVLKVGYPYTSPLSLLPGATAENYRTLDPNGTAAKGPLTELFVAVAKDAGLQIRLMPMVTGDLVSGLNAKDIDIALYIATNAANIAVSDAIVKNSEILLVGKSDTKDYRSWDDLKGEVVGIQPTNLCFAEVQKGNPFKELKVIAGAEFDASVNNGTLRFGLGGSAINWKSGSLAAANPNVRWVGSYQPHCIVSFGVAVRTSDEALLKKLNASLAKLKADGTTKATFTKFQLDFALAN